MASAAEKKQGTARAWIAIGERNLEPEQGAFAQPGNDTDGAPHDIHAALHDIQTQSRALLDLCRVGFEQRADSRQSAQFVSDPNQHQTDQAQHAGTRAVDSCR